jgi:hypothetical protein
LVLRALETLHERLVDAAERLRESIRLLAEVVGERNQPFEVDAAAPELGTKLLDDLLEVLGELLCVFQ